MSTDSHRPDGSLDERSRRLAAGTRRLQDELDRIRAGLEAEARQLADMLEAEAVAPLMSALRRAREAHGRLMNELGLPPLPTPEEDAAGDIAPDGSAESEPAAEGSTTEGSAQDEAAQEDEEAPEGPADAGTPLDAPPPPAPSWEAIRRYRQGVHREVIQPLLTTLDRHTPWVATEAAFTDFEAGVAALARRAPSGVERAEPAELYGSQPDDSPFRSLGKLAVRSGRSTAHILGAPVRALGSLTGAPEGTYERSQDVPLRHLAQDCLRGETPGDLRPAREAAWQQLAEPLARVEAAVARWNRRWFPLELTAEPPDAHLNPELLEDLTHFQEAAARAAAELEAAADQPDPSQDGGAEATGTTGDGEQTGEDGTDDASNRSAPGEGQSSPVETQGDDTGESGDETRESGDDTEERGADTRASGEGVSPTDDGSIPAEPGAQAPSPEAPTLEGLDAALDAVRGLQAALDATTTDSASAAAPVVDAIVQARWAFFASAVSRVGAFHAFRGTKGRERGMVRATQGTDRRVELWGDWFTGVADRIRFTGALLDTRVHTEAVHDRLANSIGEEGILQLADRWSDARDLLLELGRRASSSPLLSAEAISSNPAAAAQAVEELRVEASAVLEEHLLAPLRDRHPGAAVQEVADDAAEALAGIPTTLPAELILNSVQEPGTAVMPSVSRRTVPLRSLARETLDAFRIESIRGSAAPLLEVLEEGARRCGEMPDVVEYNLAAARDELLAAAEAGQEQPVAGSPTEAAADASGDGARAGATTAEGPEPKAVDPGEILELTVQGLERSAAGVDALLQIFPPAWDTFENRIHDTIPGTFREIHRRSVAEGMVQEQMLDLRSLFRRRIRSWRRSLAQLTERGQAGLRRLSQWASPFIKGLLRRGQVAVGAVVGEEDEERALDVIRGVQSLVSEYPLVYRRLFSFEPVSDPHLLSGRDAERSWVRERYEGWHAGRTLPCLVISEPGAGVTSLFNVLARDDFQGVEVGRVEVDDRIRDEAHATSILGDILGIPEPADTLEALSDQVLAADRDTIRSVVFIEGLEYFQSRVGDGSELLARILTFQAHLSARVFWLSAIGVAGWSRFSVTRATAATLVATKQLKLLSREEMEQSIMARHRRSGLPLVFQPPADLSPLRARKIKRAATPEEAQAILQEDFFDRVHKTSAGSQAMADVVWLRSLTLNPEEQRALVRAPRPIRFAFLEQLTPAIDFALMAFLEHGSLTTDEYRDILRAPEQEVLRIFEALRTRLLLQAVSDEDTIPFPVDSVEPGVTYRVPQILGVAVAARLRSLNILH